MAKRPTKSPKRTKVDTKKRNNQQKQARPKVYRIECTVISPNKNPFTVIQKLMKTKGMEAAREVIYDEGKFLASKLQLNLLQQTLPLKPLSPAYAEYKARNGLDPRILIATGEYVSKIDARKKQGGDIVDVNVPDVRHESSGLNLRELARIHEYGQKRFKDTGKGIPPRPHWRPTIKWWKKKRLESTEKEIDKYVGERVFKELSSKLSTVRTNIKPRKTKR